MLIEMLLRGKCYGASNEGSFRSVYVEDRGWILAIGKKKDRLRGEGILGGAFMSE